MTTYDVIWEHIHSPSPAMVAWGLMHHTTHDQSLQYPSITDVISRVSRIDRPLCVVYDIIIAEFGSGDVSCANTYTHVLHALGRIICDLRRRIAGESV